MGGGYNTDFVSTVGVDYKNKTIHIDGERVKVQVWDTAGQERFRNIAPVYFRGSDGLMLVFNVHDETSFENIRQWMSLTSKHLEKSTVPRVLVGNKADTNESQARKVSTAQGQVMAAEFGIPFVETSARDNTNIVDAFIL